MLFLKNLERLLDDGRRKLEDIAEGLHAIGGLNFRHFRACAAANDEVSLLVVILDAFFAVKAIQDRVGHHFAVETLVPVVLEFFDRDAFDGVLETELHRGACATCPEFHRFKRRAHEAHAVRGKREKRFAGAERLRERHLERVENQVTRVKKVGIRRETRDERRKR